MGNAKFIFRLGCFYRIDQRVPYKFHVDAGLFVNVFLKREDHQHLVDEFLDLSNTAFARRPYLRADVVNNRSAYRPNAFRQGEIESRKIDQDRRRRRICIDAIGQTMKSL